MLPFCTQVPGALPSLSLMVTCPPALNWKESLPNPLRFSLPDQVVPASCPPPTGLPPGFAPGRPPPGFGFGPPGKPPPGLGFGPGRPPPGFGFGPPGKPPPGLGFGPGKPPPGLGFG